MSGSNTSDRSWQANEAGQVANTEGNGNGLPCPLRSGQATTETLLGSTRLKCLAAAKKSVQPSAKQWFSTNTNMISYMRYMRQSQGPRTTVKQSIFFPRLPQLKNGGECLLLCQVTCCLGHSDRQLWQHDSSPRRVAPKITRFR